MLKKLSIVVVLISLGVLSNMDIVSAKDFDARISLNKRSQSAGLDRDSIKLVKRLPGSGRNAVIEKLVKRFSSGKGVITTAGKSKRHEREESTSIHGDGWRVKVWGSGSKSSYFNQNTTRHPQYKVVRLKERFTNAALEKMGRKFIEQQLGGLVKIGPDEEIIPLFTEFEIAGGVSADGKMEEETVISSIIQFGRRIDGIDIVGSGSQIAIYFGNDGVPIAFDVDWPKYKRTDVVQKTIPVDQIFKRLDKVGSKVSDGDEVELRRFECGYFDAGELNYDPDSHIQAGCVAHRVYKIFDNKTGDNMISPILYDIPAGAEVIVDKNWWEAQLIGNNCADSKFYECNPAALKAEQGQGKISKGLVEGLSNR